jgi:predicted CoA-binding protein
MSTDPQNDVIERILGYTRTIAVVGASRDPDKSAHGVPAMLQREGYRIIPVNPHAAELLGEPVHRTLATIAEPVDLVDVFRPSADAVAVVRDAVGVGARAVWLQLGIASTEARAIAEAAGLDYVEDRCLAVEVRLRGSRPAADSPPPR